MKLIKILMHLISWVQITVVFMPLYAMLTVLIQHGHALHSSHYLYMAGLFIVPVSVITLAAKHLAHLWQYVAVALLVLSGTLLLTHDWIALICLTVFTVVNLAGRVQGTETVFEAPHPFGALIFTVPFVYSGIVNDPFLQEASILLFAVYLVLALTRRGLVRLTTYIGINEGMADFPGRRIRRTSTAIILVTAALTLAVAVPTILGGDSFVPIELKSGSISLKPTSVENTITDNAPNNLDLSDAFGEPREPWIGFIILGYIVVGITILGAVAMVVYAIYTMSKNFSRTVSEKNDVIESTVDLSETLLSRTKKDKLRLLDFSQNAVVRKRYKRFIKQKTKEAPKPWSSPAEIEDFVGAKNEPLHALYEKARYSKDGCTKNDLEK